MKGFVVAAAAAAMMLASSGQSIAADGPTLAQVKKRGFVACGAQELAGFSLPDSAGKWQGFDVDYCRALSAAIFGDPDKVEYTPTTDQNRFAVLQAGEVDLLSRTTTVTFARDTTLGIDFGPINFYTGDAFMVSKSLGVEHATDLKSATVCVRQGSSTERFLINYSQAHNLDLTPLVITELAELTKAFFSGRCEAWATDQSQLAAVRATTASNPTDYVILPEVFSKSPLAPVVRQDDPQWRDIVNWLVYATFQAEESGITSANVDEFRNGSDPELKKMLGGSPGIGADLGLSDDWVYNVIKAVGNYEEIYNRNVGPDTPFNMPRGSNSLWTKGGLLYSPPFI